jgi:mycothiol S-conjugate amidase
VHDISVAAFDACADRAAYPEAGPPWQPLKLYYWAWSRARWLALHERFLELGLESPIDPSRLERQGMDERITTRIAVPDWAVVRRAALLAHATQIDPESPFWFGLPEDADPCPYDEYILARSLVETELPETDLFAGI